MAPQYETQAAYEEKHQKWSAAATSWGKVVEGRPDDPKALVRAAITLIEAKGDLHLARKFAQHAVEVAPDDVATHFALGRVFHAAGLWLNAKRELELVRRIDPAHTQAASLLKDIATHT
jgi:predicted TPR repeat methyltransferase